MAGLGLVALACAPYAEPNNEADAAEYEAAMKDGGGMAAPGGGGSGSGQAGGEAGILTAAEWQDLVNWSFWGGLMTGDYSKMNTYWGLNTSKRIAVKVTDQYERPVNRAAVKLTIDAKTLWETCTDNKGEASLWLAVTNVQETVSAADCRISIDGAEQPEAPALWAWDAAEPVVNEYKVEVVSKTYEDVDIAFIVDATGSMSDEISFLKQDLRDILSKAGKAAPQRKIFTATVFYRDNDGDDYLTRFSNFTPDVSSTMDFIGQQSADGGGDTPEAVHTALEVALSQLQWHSSAYAKLAFLVLDAPAHKDQSGVIESLQVSIESFARKGIKIIPVFCSSNEKECEFMCRQFAILTGGTYVVLTGDSGVGGDHVTASVGDYQVEHLNTLILRLINRYLE